MKAQSYKIPLEVLLQLGNFNMLTEFELRLQEALTVLGKLKLSRIKVQRIL